MKAATLSTLSARIFFQLAGTGQTELVARSCLSLTEVIGLVDVYYARNGQAALGVHPPSCPQTGPRHGGAVIGIVAADDHPFVRLSLAGPVVAHHAQHGVVALGTRAGEEDVVEVGRRDPASRAASSAAGGVAGLEEEVVGQLLHLASGGIHQLLTAVAHVDAPQTRHPVQNALAFGVFQIDAFGLGDDATALLVQGLKNR